MPECRICGKIFKRTGARAEKLCPKCWSKAIRGSKARKVRK